VRLAVFVLFASMQLSILLTGNYGFFNWLSLAVCLFVLDDSHLARLPWVRRRTEELAEMANRADTADSADTANRADTPDAPPDSPRAGAAVDGAMAESPPIDRVRSRVASRARAATIALAALAVIVVPLSVVPFLRFLRPPPEIARITDPVRRQLSNWRSLNAYHLFASMTLVRREAIIEGSADGETWHAYEFRHKPGDPARAPAFVAPHQPRVDFQMWFLLLGGRVGAEYFDVLLARMREDPAAVAPLFAHDPFAGRAPPQIRVAVYRYTFTDVATRRETGNWWTRELQGYSDVIEGS
jgi:hypothetical protein